MGRRFKDDGTPDSITHIDMPPGAAHWFANLLGIFLDGNFLIAGQTSATADGPSAGSWRPFTGIYDASGRFVSEVTLPDDVVNEDVEKTAGSPQQSAGAAAPTPAGTAKGTLIRSSAPVDPGVLIRVSKRPSDRRAWRGAPGRSRPAAQPRKATG
jgi:hypothetical protein